uniref:Protein kinase domain-containing protein n=1 Tax=Panagrolaimus superbus TaxID=310955 RepID=A0A914YJV4_9BILA
MDKALKAIQDLHSFNLLHQDIKLENFAMSLESPDEVILIDFGIAANVEKNGICPRGQFGTPSFSARDALGKEPERQHYKSDIESWFYCLIYAANDGYLEWAGERDIAALLKAKKAAWKNQTKFLMGLPVQFLEIMNAINLFKRERRPNYEKIYALLKQVMNVS